MADKAIDVAKYIAGYCIDRNHPITNLKLQKMMYFAWIDYYGEKNTELFDEKMEAWKFGPVVPDVYYHFSVFAGNPITRVEEASVTDADTDVLDRIIARYIDKPVSSLVTKSHRPGGAWDLTFRNGAGFKEAIPVQRILDNEVNRQWTNIK